MPRHYETTLPVSTDILLTTPGNRMSGGQIHKILLNPVYLGKTRHKDKLWPGKHAAIIDQDLWDRVQQKLQLGARRCRGRTIGGSQQSLLTGKLCDDTGDRLTPTHSTKSGRRHGYYISNRLISGGPDPTGWRLPARALEKSISGLIADHIGTAANERRMVTTPELRNDGEVQKASKDLVQRLREQDTDLLRSILVSGTVSPKEIRLVLDKVILAPSLGIPAEELDADLCDICAPLQLRRRGVEAKLVIGERRPAPDAILTQALREAHRWAQALKDGTPLKTIAADKNCTSGFIRKRGQLAFLSPKIQIAIRDGTLPQDITTDHILRQRIPLDWMMQERMFGM